MRFEEIARVQIVVPRKLECLAVETIAAGFCHHIHDAGIRIHDRHDEPLHDLELFDRRNGDIQRQVTQPAFCNRDSVDGETDEILLGACNRDVPIRVARLGGQEVRTRGPAILRGAREIA
jgi:hypothetical protein